MERLATCSTPAVATLAAITNAIIPPRDTSPALVPMEGPPLTPMTVSSWMPAYPTNVKWDNVLAQVSSKPVQPKSKINMSIFQPTPVVLNSCHSHCFFDKCLASQSKKKLTIKVYSFIVGTFQMRLSSSCYLNVQTSYRYIFCAKFDQFRLIRDHFSSCSNYHFENFKTKPEQRRSETIILCGSKKILMPKIRKISCQIGCRA